MKSGHERPINGLAARVVGEGVSFEYRIKDGSVNSPLPLPVRPLTEFELIHPGAQDLSGSRSGRLVIVGLSSEAKGRWVCRCCCGIYVLRTAKAIKSLAPTNCCDHCRLLAAAKSADYFRRTGKRLGMEKFL
jgi:hypothetical protein